ncbi:MAG: serine/threonine protein kinase [Kiritimatiellae bacterium]|nr:serine/threonine protein kinase [Kiritimatiellia bacterium]
MLNDTDIGGLDKFLASSGKDALPRVQEHDNILATGATLGSWRVEAFLGRGGSGEVYRVVHSVTRTPAAAKVLTRDDEVTKKRFHDEIDFLAQNQLPQFPRYFESGECDGRAYLVLELLEPMDIPTGEKGIAEYLTDVCSCVRALHLSGIVHRDLKPKNIMRRSSGEVVLIDFGLAKDTFVSARPRTDVSIVSGKAVGVGTPEYAAPEQLTGGEISPAADIHALGRIANAAFGGNPPRSWETIIRRATSSIPAQRYETVDDFVTAIRNRNRSRYCMIVGLAAASLLAVILLYFKVVGFEQYAWYRLCENVQTNLVSQQVLWQKFETNKMGLVILKERACRNVANELQVSLVRLKKGNHVFARPLNLKADHEYWIAGPGTLDALMVSEGSNTTLRLHNCVVLNRSKIPFAKSGIRYVFQGYAYLNFTSQIKPSGFSVREFEGFDVSDAIRFKGPESLGELRDLQQKENLEYFKKRLKSQRETKNLHFPRHIFAPNHEYLVESMDTKDKIADGKGEGFNYRLDPDRIRTDAEVATFAEVFQITVDEAKRILKAAGRKCQS